MSRIASFAEFWPHYVREHHRPGTRRLHFLGTTLALVAIVAAIAFRQGWLLALALGVGYGLAWLSHFLIQRNRPTTLRYPLWSLGADLKMWAWTLAGRMTAEVARVMAAPVVGQVSNLPGEATRPNEFRAG